MLLRPRWVYLYHGPPTPGGQGRPEWRRCSTVRVMAACIIALAPPLARLGKTLAVGSKQVSRERPSARRQACTRASLYTLRAFPWLRVFSALFPFPVLRPTTSIALTCLILFCRSELWISRLAHRSHSIAPHTHRTIGQRAKTLRNTGECAIMHLAGPCIACRRARGCRAMPCR